METVDLVSKVELDDTIARDFGTDKSTEVHRNLMYTSTRVSVRE